jgi:hypothetical protein
LGLSIAAVFDPGDDELPACEPGGVLELQAARPGSPPRTPIRATADSAVRARNLFMARNSLLRAIRFGLANYYSL